MGGGLYQIWQKRAYLLADLPTFHSISAKFEDHGFVDVCVNKSMFFVNRNIRSEYRSALRYLTERTTTRLHFPHKHSAAVRGGPLQTCCCERSIWPVYNLITGHVERAVREILEAAGYEGVVEPCHVIGYGLGAVEFHLEERSQRRIDRKEHVS